MTTATLPDAPAAPTRAADAGPRWDAEDAGPRFVADRAALLAAASAVSAVTKARTPRPMLACVRLEAAGDAVRVQATDLERRAWSEAVADVRRPGTCLVPADRLAEWLGRATGDAVAVDAGGGKARLVCAAASIDLFGMDPADWPAAGGGDDPEPLGTVSAAEFARLIDQTEPFTVKPKDGTGGRYAFNGMLLLVERGKLTAVATDGKRLAVARTPWAGGKLPAGLVVPAAALAVAAKGAKADPDGEVGIWADDAAAVFRAPGVGLRTNLLAGSFPPYADVIPQECDKELAAPREALLAAVRQASVACDDVARGLRLFLGKHGARMTTRNPAAGSGEASVACKYAGADLEVGVNPDFLAAALSACTGDDVRVEFTAANRPMLLTDGGSDFLAVIMPVSLS
jgi:DNA polymerase III subunit beta